MGLLYHPLLGLREIKYNNYTRTCISKYSWPLILMENKILLWPIQLKCEVLTENSKVKVNKMCLWNTDAPSHNKVKISKSFILNPPQPQEDVMSVKCEKPLDELLCSPSLITVSPSKLKILHSKCGMKLRTDRHMDGRTEALTIKLLMLLANLSGRVHKNVLLS